MRSLKLLVATAAVAAFVAGPVLAQDAMTGSTPSTPSTTSSTTTPKHHVKKHATKKHHKKAADTAPAAAPMTPAQ